MYFFGNGFLCFIEAWDCEVVESSKMEQEVIPAIEKANASNRNILKILFIRLAIYKLNGSVPILVSER